MKTDACHFLIVEKGEPYAKGDRIPLNHAGVLIGRSWKTDRPQVAFDSLYVSRRHAVIAWEGSGFTVRDLGSKHGTVVNGTVINPKQSCPLQNGDSVSIAKGIVAMTYRIFTDFDDRTITLTNVFSNPIAGISIDLDRQEVYVDGELLNFSGKERDLLLFLYRNLNKAVSYESIKSELWPERVLEGETVPDVEASEVTALLYRLRKRLGAHGDKVVTVARFGVFLKLE